MRISNQMISMQAKSNIAETLERVTTLQDVTSSGKRINKASDDPVGTNQALTLRSSIADIDQYSSNANYGKAQLSVLDTQLGDISQAIQNALSYAQIGATATTSDTERLGYATQVQQQVDNIVQAVNTTYLNQYIFSGNKTDAAAVAESSSNSGTYAYQGDDGVKKIQVSDSSKIGISVTAKEVLNFNGASDSSTSDVLTILNNLKTSLQNNDTTGMQTAIDQLSKASDNVTGIRAKMGARLSQVELVTNRLTDTKSTLSNLDSKIENADLATTVVDLQAAQNAYQASLYVTAQMNQSTLVDYLK